MIKSYLQYLQEGLKDTSEKEFDKLISKSKIVVVLFYSKSSKVSMLMIPVFEKVQKKYKNKAVFIKCNLDDFKGTRLHKEIKAIPAILIFSKKKVVSGVRGLISTEGLESFLDGVL